MSTTNEAFIKAYRTDAASSPRPAHLREATGAPWQPTVEIVSPDRALQGGREEAAGGTNDELPNDEYRMNRSSFAIRHSSSSSPPAAEFSLGKRPLSTFFEERTDAPHGDTEVFTPETTLSAFRWPRVARTLWAENRDQYDRVAELLVERSGGQGLLVGVSGLRSGDGCTTTLLCLAMALAARQVRTILVDAHFGSPWLAQQLGVEPTVTWYDVFARGAGVAEAVIRSAGDGVDLLPLAGKRTPRGNADDAARLAESLQVSVTSGVLRDAYPVTLVDLGPVLEPDAPPTTGTLLETMRLDLALLVAHGHTEARELAAAGGRLVHHGCEVLGAIENRVCK